MITVIGMDGRGLAPAAQAALAGADLVCGAARHLDTLAIEDRKRLVLGPLTPALDELVRADDAGRRAVVAASGDPGFFGIVRALRARGREVVVHSATSSVAHAFAAVGLPWEDAVVVSAHGRDLGPALNVCRAQPKVAVLTAPGSGPAEIGAALLGTDRVLIVATDLGAEAEDITRCTPEEAAARQWRDPNVLLVLQKSPREAAQDRDTDTQVQAGWLAGHQGAPAGWALPENSFEYRDSMITKAEVRALVLARLAPRIGSSVWDIGAGSGSVAIECARFGAAVAAVERDRDACKLIAANARRHDVVVDIVHGSAPEALLELAERGDGRVQRNASAHPIADAVFVGGGGVDVLRSALKLAQPQRAVITLAALDRVAEARAALLADGLTVDGVQLQAARLADLPDNSVRLQATNPVFVLWGERP